MNWPDGFGHASGRLRLLSLRHPAIWRWLRLRKRIPARSFRVPSTTLRWPSSDTNFRLMSTGSCETPCQSLSRPGEPGKADRALTDVLLGVGLTGHVGLRRHSGAVTEPPATATPPVNPQVTALRTRLTGAVSQTVVLGLWLRGG